MFRTLTHQYDYHPIEHNTKHVYFNICLYKKQTLLFIVFLFTIPVLYFVSHAATEFHFNGNIDFYQTLLEIVYNSSQTLCSEEAARHGYKQRVIAISVFGPKENQLFTDEKFPEFITLLINDARLYFPTWIIRLYSDNETIDRLNLNNLTHLSPNIDICNVNQIPILGDVAQYLSGKLWRFLPALDSTVDIASSRDLDSPFTEREQVIVDQFINSSYLFLIARDHPNHGTLILGGLWTAALYRNRLLFVRLFSVLLDKYKAKRYTLARDQLLLRELVWPTIKSHSLIFDSYTCEQFPEGNPQPYPVQRSSIDCHLGCIRPCCQNSSRNVVLKPCPEKCRPKNHPEWTYC